MSTLPGYRFERLRFYAPIQVGDVRLEADQVVGRWTLEVQRHYSSANETRLAERFVNLDGSPDSILRFTRKYGPLIRANSDEKGGFRFPLDTWRKNQGEFRLFWRAFSSKGKPKDFSPSYTPLGGNSFEVRRGWLDFCCADLWTFVTLEVFLLADKLRICERPDCRRYFFSNHGKERYCSTFCANWSQAQLKRRWHEKRRLQRRTARNTR